MSEPLDSSTVDVAARIEDLVREVRKQGRAAVAAQAAAESCLEVVTRLRDDGAGDRSRDEDDRDADGRDVAWLEALLPSLDALDRIVAQAASAATRRAAAGARRGLWPFGRSSSPLDADSEALHEGLRVLRAQLGGALAELGVAVDRRTGGAVEPDLHRVVEVRAAASAAGAPARVVDVVRPGYALRGRVVREADVVASSAAPAHRHD